MAKSKGNVGVAPKTGPMPGGVNPGKKVPRVMAVGTGKGK